MKNKLLFFLGLFIPVLFVYKKMLLPGPLAFGDAPYFYKEALSIFTKNPQAWWSLSDGLGGVNLFIFLSPVMYLYGLLGELLGNNLATRLVFYFPAIIFSFVTPVIFTRYFRFSKTAQFFTSLVYGLNTYFILLIDGGQVGVSLAYSLFPFVLIQLHKTNDIRSLLSIFLLTIIDPRIAVICLLTTFLIKPKLVFRLGLIGLLLIPLNAFWLLPLVKNGGGSLATSVSSLGFIKIFHTLSLYQPHWPENIYGLVSQPPLYFFLVPVLVFIGFILNKNNKHIKKYFILFLLFAFLAKGESAPFGVFYKFVVENVPLGSTLRDSSKFFTPLVLFGGVLIGSAVDRFKNLWVKVAIYLFLLLLISPAVLGKMNFVLSSKVQSSDYQKIYKHLKNNPGEYKTLWFPERPTLGFQSEKNPAIDAKSLVSLKPIASLNTGSSDVFNFMGKPESSMWLQTLGVRYMFFPGTTRKLSLRDQEKIEWENLLENVSQSSNLIKLDWGTEMGVYELKDYKGKTTKTNNVKAVIGGDETPGDIYLEDGLVDPKDLNKLPAGSLMFDLGDGQLNNLQFTFLQSFFLSQKDIVHLEWAKYGSDEYLLWKYQLLIRGIETFQRDYQKGILLSTNSDEKIVYTKDIEKGGEYIVGVRGMGYGDNKLSLDVGSKMYDVSQNEGDFRWNVFEVDLKKGKNEIVIENKNGTQIINTVAVVPLESWEESKILANEFVEKFGKSDGGVEWLIYSQNYNPLFILDCGNIQISSTPIYSSLNAFPLINCDNPKNVYFEGQKWLDLGIKISLASFAIISLWAIISKKLFH